MLPIVIILQCMTSYNANDQKLLSQFGVKVSELRLENGVSQEKLAEIAGLHRTYIGSVERGGRRRAGRCGAGGERECSSLIIYSSTFVLECIVVGGGGVTSFVVHEVLRN